MKTRREKKGPSSVRRKASISLWLMRGVLMVSVVIFLYAGYHILEYVMEERASRSVTDQLIDSAVTVTDETEIVGHPVNESTGAVTEDLPEIPDPELRETAPISVDFEELQQQYPDIIGWIYSPDTVINYPVVQGEDNDYYLRRLVDGSRNPAGTLFLDYVCASDLSDPYSLIYGHNMKNDTMFGTLTEYNEQEYYDEHPVMYLLTPNAEYRLDLLAGYLTEDDSDTYQIPKSEENVQALLEYALSHSTFDSDVSGENVDEQDRYLVLSTCSYEYDEARYVLIGRLTQLDER